MNILIAPDKFKGTLSAAEAAAAIAAGLRSVDADLNLDMCPIADGGEGTVAALVAATGGQLITQRVTGPLPEMKVDATFGMLGDGKMAVIEMSAASGLALLKPEDRNPLNTTTFGTGELIAAAVARRAEKIILGIGGSATIDAGVGCAQACGFTVLLRDGEQTSRTEPLCGRDLSNVLMIKHGRGEITNGIEIVVASDVTNPLLGENGAARVFGPQKGASATEVEEFDEQLRAFAERTGKMVEASAPGAGAAGGLGFGMLAFFGASLRSGFEIVAQAVDLSSRIGRAQVCITGEGRLDAQSIGGKATIGVAKLCRAAGIPCIAIVGSVGEGAQQALAQGLTAYFSMSKNPGDLEMVMRDAAGILEQTAADFWRHWDVVK